MLEDARNAADAAGGDEAIVTVRNDGRGLQADPLPPRPPAAAAALPS